MTTVIDTGTHTTKPAWDIDAVRRDFPILQQKVHGHPLVYLDNAATSQKPQVVIDAISNYYETINSNVHRGVHSLSEFATQAYEGARVTIQQFINAAQSKEIIFTRGTTESINLVAQSYGRQYIKAGDEIIVSAMEHHSNIVPWQLLAEQNGATIKVIPINDAGELCLDSYEKLFTPRTKLVAVGHISNALGTVNPVDYLTKVAHQNGAKILIDGAQALPHCHVDVQALDCDFYAASAHKAFGPTGMGILYGKQDLLQAMPPYQGGGEMIRYVTFEKTEYNELPHKFEAGTPNIAGAIGFGAALTYLQKLGMDNIAAYEKELLDYATQLAEADDNLRLIGTAKQKAGVLSFLMKNVHAHDIGTIVDTHGVAIRTGHHCAMPVMEHFNVAATARASFAFYNTKAEIDSLFAALRHVEEVFA